MELAQVQVRAAWAGDAAASSREVVLRGSVNPGDPASDSVTHQEVPELKDLPSLAADREVVEATQSGHLFLAPSALH